MKRILSLSILALIAFLPMANAQKFGYWRADTFLIRPAGNTLIFGRIENAGYLKQINDKEWDFFPDPIRVFHSSYYRKDDVISHSIFYKQGVNIYHPPANLFDDCVFLDPAKRFLQFIGERRMRGMPDTRVNDAASLRFYSDTAMLHTTYTELLAEDSLPPSVITPYFQPFYFRKCEVSNAEYHEFVNWVVDSIERVELNYVLPNGLLDRKKKIDISDTAVKHKIDDICLPPEKRFWHRREIDSKKLIYKFEHAPAEYGHDTIHIYPDTLSWVNDFYWGMFTESMTNMYFWHPVYSAYPVAGVNYWQCFAYLEWKSKQLEQQVNRKGKHYRIVCALPKEREWDFASSAEPINDTISVMGQHYMQYCDYSWFTDLRLSVDTGKYIRIYDSGPDSLSEDYDYRVRNPNRKMWKRGYNPDEWNPNKRLLHMDEYTQGEFVSDRNLYTAPVSLEKFQYEKHPHVSKKWEKEEYKKDLANERFMAHFDKLSGINYLDGNVSEWLREDLDSTWRPIFAKHMHLVNNPLYDQFLLERNLENYYFKQLPSHGKLIRGCNWFDERYSNKYGKNTAGTNAKTFEEPVKAHCTVGFRYVIYVYPQ